MKKTATKLFLTSIGLLLMLPSFSFAYYALDWQDSAGQAFDNIEKTEIWYDNENCYFLGEPNCEYLKDNMWQTYQINNKNFYYWSTSTNASGINAFHFATTTTDHHEITKPNFGTSATGTFYMILNSGDWNTADNITYDHSISSHETKYCTEINQINGTTLEIHKCTDIALSDFPIRNLDWNINQPGTYTLDVYLILFTDENLDYIDTKYEMETKLDEIWAENKIHIPNQPSQGTTTPITCIDLNCPTPTGITDVGGGIKWAGCELFYPNCNVLNQWENIPSKMLRIAPISLLVDGKKLYDEISFGESASTSTIVGTTTITKPNGEQISFYITLFDMPKIVSSYPLFTTIRNIWGQLILFSWGIASIYFIVTGI